MKELTEVKKKIAWIEKEKDNITEWQKEDLVQELKDINKALTRIMLTFVATNKSNHKKGVTKANADKLAVVLKTI